MGRSSLSPIAERSLDPLRPSSVFSSNLQDRLWQKNRVVRLSRVRQMDLWNDLGLFRHRMRLLSVFSALLAGAECIEMSNNSKFSPEKMPRIFRKAPTQSKPRLFHVPGPTETAKPTPGEGRRLRGRARKTRCGTYEHENPGVAPESSGSRVPQFPPNPATYRPAT